MLFQEEHIEMIRDGQKTETRRTWDKPQVKEGNVYMAATELFTSHEEADCYIRVTDINLEPLNEMDEAAADAEGGYSLEEFREVWRDIHGTYHPHNMVWVVRFEYVGRSKRDEQAIRTDGGRMVGTYCLECKMMTGLAGHAPGCDVGGDA